MSEKNELRILLPTPVTPPKKDILGSFVNNTLHHLQEKKKTKIIWLVHQPDKISTIQEKMAVCDIHDYSDAKNLLESLRPDCIILGQTYEPINYSISIAAKFLKIPLIAIYFYDHQLTMRQESSREYLQYLISLFRRIISNKVPTDDENNKKIMKRGRFMIYKYNFLIKTKKSLGINSLKIVKSLINDFMMFLLKTYPEYNKLADINLLSNESWFLPLFNLGFEKEKLIVTGNPFWDSVYKKIKEQPYVRTKSITKIRVLVLTDPLVEHGLWNSKKRDQFLTDIILELKKFNDIVFSLKIHPSSENILYYEKLLKKLDIKTTIYQVEDLWDLISMFDIVLSYGQGYAHTELAAGMVKLIIVDPEREFIRMPLVKEGISCGHVMICENHETLRSSINELLDKQTQLTKEFVEARNELFFQFEGNAGKLAANQILKILENEQIK